MGAASDGAELTAWLGLQLGAALPHLDLHIVGSGDRPGGGRLGDVHSQGAGRHDDRGSLSADGGGRHRARLRRREGPDGGPTEGRGTAQRRLLCWAVDAFSVRL